ncbi:MAG: bifunctional folylpolyglutamate synthase/dihydrofolate synthase [Luteibaculaceae bacterium]
MSYKETLEFLYSQLPIFHRIGPAALKPNLENTVLLAKEFDNPHHNQIYIHVAGTNGKGSVSHMLASIFQHAGYKTGLYTSPHLTDFRERIKINGKKIPKKSVINFVKRAKPSIHKIKPSFFELTFIMAIEHFKQQKTDIAIIETGLGGLLDSTNIITPILSIITNIGYDHQDILGKTLPEIAHQKAGIIKPKIPFVMGEPTDTINSVFFKHQAEKQSPRLETPINLKLKTDLIGGYQKQNLNTIGLALPFLKQKFKKLSNKIIQKAILNTAATTGLRGRFQILQSNPTVIADVAHNISGIQEVLSQIQKYKYKQLRIVFGVMADKKLETIIPLLPQDAVYYICQPKVPRALDASLLTEALETANLSVVKSKTTKTALSKAIKSANKKDLILCFGSFFVVSEVLVAANSLINKAF